MSRRRWIAVFAIFVVGLSFAIWVWRSQGMPEESEIVGQLRNASRLTIKTFASTDEYGPEQIGVDREKLAKSFLITKKVGNYTVSSATAVGVFTSDDYEHPLFYLYPSTNVRFRNTLYHIESGFWTELLRQAPKTKAWLMEKTPLSFQEGEPIDR